MIVFFGTSPRSARFLELSVKAGLKFDLVVSEPPKPIGRKQILTENPTATIAKKLKIPYLLDQLDLLVQPLPTLGLILDFNKMISQKIINFFQKGIINIHFSKLPQGRGPAPVQATILNADKEAWITYYLITQKLDEGPILKQTSLPLDFTETTDSLYKKLITKAATESPKIITDYLEGKPYKVGTDPKMTPNKANLKMCYTYKLTTENCRIDWQKPPAEIEKLIRASNSEPGAWCNIQLAINNLPAKSAGQQLTIKRLKILKAHLEKISIQDRSLIPIQDRKKLVLDQVQLEGKKPVSWQQFQQGYPQAKLL